MDKLKPASKGMGPTYDPQSETMHHDSVFKEVAPAAANSGNLAHQWYPDGDHSCSEAPPTGLRGD